MITFYYIIVASSVMLFSALFCFGLYLLYGKLEWLAHPTERSNHERAIPTGLGLGFILVAAGFLAVVNAPGGLVWPLLLLVGVSVVDERKSLPITTRLFAQSVAVAIGLTTLDPSMFQGAIPDWLGYGLLFFGWIWFINLFNFMDGIDEISILQTCTITLGVIIFSLLEPDLPRFFAIDAMVFLSAIIAFIPFNRHPARAFMGDSGSIPLGFAMGYLLLQLAATGHWQAALILPAYYLTDASITLVRRMISGETFWHGHSSHAYQLAVRKGHSHRFVTVRLMAVNLVLLVLAGFSIYEPHYATPAMGVAYLFAVGLMLHFMTARPSKAVMHAPAL